MVRVLSWIGEGRERIGPNYPFYSIHEPEKLFFAEPEEDIDEPKPQFDFRNKKEQQDKEKQYQPKSQTETKVHHRELISKEEEKRHDDNKKNKDKMKPRFDFRKS